MERINVEHECIGLSFNEPGVSGGGSTYCIGWCTPMYEPSLHCLEHDDCVLMSFPYDITNNKIISVNANSVENVRGYEIYSGDASPICIRNFCGIQLNSTTVYTCGIVNDELQCPTNICSIVGWIKKQGVTWNEEGEPTYITSMIPDLEGCK